MSIFFLKITGDRPQHTSAAAARAFWGWVGGGVGPSCNAMQGWVHGGLPRALSLVLQYIVMLLCTLPTINRRLLRPHLLIAQFCPWTPKRDSYDDIVFVFAVAPPKPYQAIQLATPKCRKTMCASPPAAPCSKRGRQVKPRG